MKTSSRVGLCGHTSEDGHDGARRRCPTRADRESWFPQVLGHCFRGFRRRAGQREGAAIRNHPHVFDMSKTSRTERARTASERARALGGASQGTTSASAKDLGAVAELLVEKGYSSAGPPSLEYRENSCCSGSHCSGPPGWQVDRRLSTGSTACKRSSCPPLHKGIPHSARLRKTIAIVVIRPPPQTQSVCVCGQRRELWMRTRARFARCRQATLPPKAGGSLHFG